MYKYCYWSVADGDHAEMMKSVVRSARAVGVQEDFHIWSDRDIDGAIRHDCGQFDKQHYLFKFKFLKEQVAPELDYDFFIFLDSDSYFVRNPGKILKILYGAPVHVCMESDCTLPENTRPDWWGCPLNRYVELMIEKGVKSKSVYNTNAGFWIVKKEVVDLFCDLAMNFWNHCKNAGFVFTEEAPLAYAGHMLMGNPYLHTLRSHRNIWASDWTGNYADRLPDGNAWQFEDYMSGQKYTVNPAIVHAMRSKDVLQSNVRNEKQGRPTMSYWMGHQMLGDVVGFCAAAHLLYHKTGQVTKIWFEERRKGIVGWFDGVEWIPRTSDMIDCGGAPRPEEWHLYNGVSRFYRYMDSSMNPGKSFDVHFNRDRSMPTEKLIGLITHSNTQGDIDCVVLDQMIAEAKKQYPEHKIVSIGHQDNHIIPNGVEDWRQVDNDVEWLFDMVARLDLLITPQSGPCFIAAGWKVPMWVYRSAEPHWDYTINYDTYRVERWWDRPSNKYYFTKIYERGGWDRNGSGGGSTPEVTRGYRQFVEGFIKDHQIKTVVDLGCGDWQFSKHMDWNNCNYLGIDVVDKIISENNAKFRSDKIQFQCEDFTKEPSGKYDLCICKDVLQHLRDEDILLFLKQLSQFKYCLITNDYHWQNLDLSEPGMWKGIDLTQYPYGVDGEYVYEFGDKKTFLVKSDVIVDVLGLQFHVRPGRNWDHTILYNVFHEYSITPNIKLDNPNEYIIIDIGAHIGGFSKRIATLYPDVLVLSFEPDRDNFELLTQNTCDSANIQIFNVGVADKTKSGFLTPFDDINSGMNVSSSSRFNNKSYEIDFIGINEIFGMNPNKKVLFMKLDCEGGEWSILDTIKCDNLNKIYQIHGEFHSNCYKFWEPFKDHPENDKVFCEKLVDQLVNKTERNFNVFFSGFNAMIHNKYFWGTDV